MSDEVKPSAAWQDVLAQMRKNYAPLRSMIREWIAQIETLAAADAQQIAELTRAVQGNALAVVKANENAAQQIAALRAENNTLLVRAEQAEDAFVEAEVHIAALQVENERWHRVAQMCGADADRWIQRVIALKDQLTALQVRFDAMSAAFGEEKALADRQIVRAEAAEDRVTALQAEQAQWQQLVARWRDMAGWEHDDMGNAQSAQAFDQCADELEAQLAALTAQQDGSLPTRQPKP